MAAEVGHLELAYDYFGEAALMDLEDLEHNVRDGVHMASLAGVWLAAVAGFGGIRDHDGALSFAPRLPEALTRLAFRLTFNRRLLEVEITHRQVTYTLVEGPALDITHDGTAVTVAPGGPVARPLTPMPVLERPTQPVGRAPARRRVGLSTRESKE